ncbi:uncharacterized protein LOC129919951 [Episyrphus balteatus]|uniref:uncharacterized protein LOC129919951 n=1 Tax=Episyrphus balteatus TaxID=286459 RepID=UPI0024869829|nr:uncharacterized protein LOC129919951 [Episyrphus balteatus]
MALPECQARDYKLQWEDIVPVIGINKFTFTREPVIGVLEILPEVMGEEGENEMGTQEDYDNEEGFEAQDDELFVRPQGSIAEAAPLANDLKGILQSWDMKKSDHHEAVLETDFYRIAIWKRDNLYFVFDPKASGDNGELTERRIEMGKDQLAGDDLSIMAAQQKQTEDNPDDDEETPRKLPSERPLYLEKRTYTHYDNQGSAYTAWFSNFDEFFEHISSKTPQDYKYGQFTLHDLILTSQSVATDDFEFKLKPGYHAITPNHSLIRGSIAQNSSSLTNRNKQEISNCIVSIAFAKITPSSKMTTTLLDVQLKYGDRLYTKSLEALKKSDMIKFMNIDKLSLEDILSIFNIHKIRFKWKINSTINGNFMLNELKKATGKLGSIENGSAMILNHKGYFMAFWKGDGGGFYLYDPFETNPNGVLVENGSGLPSMSKFTKLDNLLHYLLSKFVCVEGLNTFTLYTIGIESTPTETINTHSTPVEQDLMTSRLISRVTRDQNLFQPYQTDMRIFKSPLLTDKIPQYGLALAALIHSRLQFVEIWNSNISQRIAFLSRYLLQKTDCEIELLRSPVTFDEIRSNFIIDNEFLCNIIFTKNIQGPVFSTKRTEIVGVNLKNALTMFFKNCQQVVVFFPGTGNAFAIWKEKGGIFYLFGIDRVEREIFVITSSILLNLYDIVVKGINPEEDLNNWYELRSVTVTIVPIKEGICKPLKITNDTVDGPLSTRSGYYVSSQAKEPFYYDYISEKPEGLLIRPQESEFFKVSKGIEILYSGDILKSHRFYGTKDFFPSLQAACVEASALARVKSPTLWTKMTLKKILLAGVKIYIHTVAGIKNSSFCTRFLIVLDFYS